MVLDVTDGTYATTFVSLEATLKLRKQFYPLRDYTIQRIFLAKFIPACKAM
jgi:hypothetical protein